MSGTKALAEFDEYLNEEYNKHLKEEEYPLAYLIDEIRDKLDELYKEYARRGD